MHNVAQPWFVRRRRSEGGVIVELLVFAIQVGARVGDTFCIEPVCV